MNPTLLCIDDQPELLQVRKAILESSAFHVETVTSAHAAIKMLAAPSVAAVLLEYKQQGIDAEAVAYQIHQRFPDIPIILLSAYFEMPERILWLVDAYVMKSELPDGLVRAIERVRRPADTDPARQTSARSKRKPAA